MQTWAAHGYGRILSQNCLTDQCICKIVVAKYLWHLTDNHWKIYDFGSTKTLCLKSLACNPLGCWLNSGYEIPSWRVNFIIHWQSFIKYWFTLALEFHYHCFEIILGGNEFVSHYVEKIRSWTSGSFENRLSFPWYQPVVHCYLFVNQVIHA